MPSTGGSDKSVAETGPGTTGTSSSSSKVAKAGSMKIKRTISSAKVLTKSKSSGSLKKKGAADQSSSSSAATAATAGARPTRDSHRSSSTSAETDLPDPKQNGSLRRAVVGEEEEDEDEVWEVGEEKKEPSIKGLWKKAFKTMKPTGDSKKPTRPKRRDSKYDVEETEEEEPKEIDPVYSLLKCAADLPKIARSQNKEGQPLTCQGAQCLAKAAAASQGAPLQRTSSASFSSGSMCAKCRGVQNEQSGSGPTAHSLGHDFKQFYKQTSPVKRLSSSSTELGI